MGDRGNALLRFVDRFAGIPAVFLTGLTVRRKPPPKDGEIRSIGILAIAAIGDTILLSAVLKDMMAALPGRSVTVFCSEGNRTAFELCMGNSVKLLRIPVKHPFKAIKIIRREPFDVFIDFGPWPRLNSLLAFASRSRSRIGFQSEGQYRHYVYNVPVEHRRDCHEIDNHRRLLAALGIESRSRPYLGQAEPDMDQPYIVLHMFPSGYKAHYKEWSDGKWIDLIDGLTSRGNKVLLSGGPADELKCRRIAEACRTTTFIDIKAGSTSLFQLGNLLQRALAVVSVNTGVMHMAAAYNQQLVALHGPTSVLRWGPLCDNAHNFTATTHSAGCLHLGFEYDSSDPHSMDSIASDKVLEAVLETMRETMHHRGALKNPD